MLCILGISLHRYLIVANVVLRVRQVKLLTEQHDSVSGKENFMWKNLHVHVCFFWDTTYFPNFKV